jgi:hypothetical protein
MIIDGTAGVTFPDTSAQPKSGYGPAFSAQGAANSIPNNSFTELTTYASKDFDTATAFNLSTGRFTPQVAGYYQCSSTVAFLGASGAEFLDLRKNGSSVLTGSTATISGLVPPVTVSGLVFLNGTTDYVSIFTYQGSGGALSPTNSRFQGIFIRGA